jgi:hypothetical protein
VNLQTKNISFRRKFFNLVFSTWSSGRGSFVIFSLVEESLAVKDGPSYLEGDGKEDRLNGTYKALLNLLMYFNHT